MSIPILTDIDMVSAAKILNLPDPTLAQHAATKAYVDALVNGLAWKDSVRAASTVNVTVATPGAAIDGVSLVSGDRVLLKNQTAGAENGIYVWTGAATPMTRSTDANTAANVERAAVSVEEGTANANTGWTQTVANPTLGTTTLTFASFGSVAAASTGTAGIAALATQSQVDTGTDNLTIVTPLTLTTWSKAPKRYQVTFGDGASTSFVITHNLNTTDVHVQVQETGGSKRMVNCEIQVTGVNSVTCVFAGIVATNALRAVVLA